jgi:hypothetical protein
MYTQRAARTGVIAASLSLGVVVIMTSPLAVLAAWHSSPDRGRDGAPLSTFESNDFSGAGNCTFCHSGLHDGAGHDVSIDTHWRSTMKANASKDPLWQAKLSSEVYRHPALLAAIEEKCSRCHMPMARVQALADGVPVEILGRGFLSPANALHEAAMDGVSCTLCHQIQAAGLGQTATFSGHYAIDTSTTSPERLIFAQFADPFPNPMRMRVGYRPVQGGHAAQAGLCGSCHTLFTPVVDGSGQIVGEFPEQMTYPEWAHSAFGDGAGADRSCQDCHMTPADGGVQIATRPMWLPERSPFAQHTFVGANQLMLRMLWDHVDELGLTALRADLAATQARTAEQLQTAAASLCVADARIDGHTLNVTLRVENRAGHKLPSGIPARRAWIHFTVSDGVGHGVFESGAPQPDGRIAGNAADEDPCGFEPHYRVISGSDQVQIYEGVMRDTDGAVTYTLLRAAEYVKDNRLLPAGFDQTSANEEIAVHGEAARDDDFIGGSDRLTYVVDVQGHCGPFALTAEFLYQPVGYRFAEDLRRDPTPQVARFSTFLDATDRSPGVLAATRQRVGTPCGTGDLNCDGVISYADINPFVLYLSNFSTWQIVYDNCPPEIGDINQDGVYPSCADIDPFIALLSSGGAQNRATVSR